MGAAAAAIAPVASLAGSALSLASLGAKSGSDVAAGYAKQQENAVKAQDYLLDARSKATNYELKGQADATNYQLQGTAAATNAELQARASAANSRFQGRAQQQQFGVQSTEDLIRAGEADTAAKFGDLQAAMTDAGARQQLATTLGNIATIRAAGGADFTSPTTAALMGRATGISDLNREASVSSINAQTAEERASANYLRQASEFALTQGRDAATMGEFNASTAEQYGDYNARTAKTFADFNSSTARQYADFNAKSALEYGQYNANAALSAGSTAVNFGFMNAGTDVLGGLGKAFAGGNFGIGGSASPSGGSAAP